MPATDSCLLITGGAGFIGSALVRRVLADRSDLVVTLDALTYAGLRRSLAEVAGNERHQLVVGDVADAALVERLLAEHRPRAVLHLAAETHVDRSIAEPPEFVRTNVLGTAALLDQSLAHWKGLPASEQERFRFLLVSTDEVFGSADGGEVFTADSPLAPNSPYSASKAAGEHLARAYANTYGLPIVTINPSNNYGPRQMPEKLIPRMILAAKRGETLPVYGDGLQQRDWLHVDDCCEAILAVLRGGVPGRRYLAGSGATPTNLEVVQRICDLVDEQTGDGPSRRRLIRHVEDRPGHDRRYAVDSSPLRKELGWQPRRDFAAGLKDTVAWYLGNVDWTKEAEDSLRRRVKSKQPG